MEIEDEKLTFEDGILLCKHIYQCAIHKTLHGVPEQWEIFQKTHDLLTNLEQKRTEQVIQNVEYRFDHKRLDDILYKLNMDSVYATV